MKAILSRVDATYEVQFKKPLLDYGRIPESPIQLIYDALSEAASISIADIVVNPGPAPGSVSVYFSLFGGLGSIELRLDRWRATFRTIRTEDDKKIVIRLINLTATAVDQLSDRTSAARTFLSVAYWYQCDVGIDGVKKLLELLGPTTMKFDPASFGGKEIEFTLNPRVWNAEEGWDARFIVQPSLLEGSHLFLRYDSDYISGGRYNSPDERFVHVEKMTATLLDQLGLIL
jgi:hypothetical protein